MTSTKTNKKSPLSKSQWIGVGVLLIIVFFIGFGMWCADYLTQPATGESELRLSTETAHRLQQSLKEKRHNRTYYKHEKRDTVPVFLHPFDPNTADSIEFLQLGFRPWMAKNVLKYRSRGGRFRTKESLRKIYGMTDELYENIEPYITIVLPSDTLSADSIPRMIFPIKKDTVIELNSADTAELQYIRGVGRYTALQIIIYREQLGGYHDAGQLREISSISERIDSILPHFFVDTTLIEPMPVNHSTVRRLQRHPYLSFTQAKALYDFRREQFKLKNIEQLSSLDEFTAEDLRRLQPYLSFEE